MTKRPAIAVSAAVCAALLPIAAAEAAAPSAQRAPEVATTRAAGATTTPMAEPGLAARKPLRGKVIVIDPGHQLGNASHPRKINRLVDAGGFMKACNTTGTATHGGYPEATFAWKVARSLRAQLRDRGATVVMTRTTNSRDDWGPCIDARGRAGNRAGADAVVSIHGDGAAASARGFFVIMPTRRVGWTDDIHRSSRRLGHRVKAGLERAGARVSNSYGGDGFDRRGDLGTLNWSNKPIVMVELGNMRNARDARHMTSPKYRRHVYARGLRIGISRFVHHR